MYRHYLDKINMYIDRVHESPEHVRKTVLMITVSVLVGLAFVGWLISLRALYPKHAQEPLFQESQTKIFGSDIHSMFQDLHDRLQNNNGSSSTAPPAYFLDTGNLPVLNQNPQK